MKYFLAVLFLFVFFSCGGSTKFIALPTQEEIKNDYLNGWRVDGELLRWEKTIIIVAVIDNELYDETVYAAEYWNNILKKNDLKNRFIVKLSGSGDIDIKISSLREMGRLGGFTDIDEFDNGQLFHATIEILRDYVYPKVIAHELGHALGFVGHDPMPFSVMASPVHDYTDMSYDNWILSPGFLSSLVKAYSSF